MVTFTAEFAASGRSSCKGKCKGKIHEGELRFGKESDGKLIFF